MKSRWKLPVILLLLSLCSIGCATIDLSAYSDSPRDYSMESSEGLMNAFSVLETLGHIDVERDEKGEAIVPKDLSLAVNAGAQRLYRMRCARCHSLIEANEYDAEDWPYFLDEFGPRSNLRPVERAVLETWLINEASR